MKFNLLGERILRNYKFTLSEFQESCETVARSSIMVQLFPAGNFFIAFLKMVQFRMMSRENGTTTTLSRSSRRIFRRISPYTRVAKISAWICNTRVHALNCTRTNEIDRDYMRILRKKSSRDRKNISFVLNTKRMVSANHPLLYPHITVRTNTVYLNNKREIIHAGPRLM